MAEVTVTTTELDIVEDIRDALTAAQISSVAVFAKVATIMSEKQAKGREFTDSPVAVVQYERTDEHHITDLRKGGVVHLTLILAASVKGEHASITEALRLKNAAVNAIQSTPPADAQAFGEDETLHRRVEFGDYEIDSTSNKPWVICHQPLEVAFVIASETQH